MKYEIYLLIAVLVILFCLSVVVSNQKTIYKQNEVIIELLLKK